MGKLWKELFVECSLNQSHIHFEWISVVFFSRWIFFQIIISLHFMQIFNIQTKRLQNVLVSRVWSYDISTWNFFFCRYTFVLYVLQFTVAAPDLGVSLFGDSDRVLNILRCFLWLIKYHCICDELMRYKHGFSSALQTLNAIMKTSGKVKYFIL